jgi:hypothetical protein
MSMTKDILFLFGEAGTPKTAKGLSSALGVTVFAVSAHLAKLQERGWVMQKGEQYRLTQIGVSKYFLYRRCEAHLDQLPNLILGYMSGSQNDSFSLTAIFNHVSQAWAKASDERLYFLEQERDIVFNAVESALESMEKSGEVEMSVIGNTFFFSLVKSDKETVRKLITEFLRDNPASSRRTITDSLPSNVKPTHIKSVLDEMHRETSGRFFVYSLPVDKATEKPDAEEAKKPERVTHLWKVAKNVFGSAYHTLKSLATEVVVQELGEGAHLGKLIPVSEVSEWESRFQPLRENFWEGLNSGMSPAQAVASANNYVEPEEPTSNVRVFQVMTQEEEKGQTFPVSDKESPSSKDSLSIRPHTQTIVQVLTDSPTALRFTDLADQVRGMVSTSSVSFYAREGVRLGLLSQPCYGVYQQGDKFEVPTKGSTEQRLLKLLSNGVPLNLRQLCELMGISTEPQKALVERTVHRLRGKGTLEVVNSKPGRATSFIIASPHSQEEPTPEVVVESVPSDISSQEEPLEEVFARFQKEQTEHPQLAELVALKRQMRAFGLSTKELEVKINTFTKGRQKIQLLFDEYQRRQKEVECLEKQIREGLAAFKKGLPVTVEQSEPGTCSVDATTLS